MPARNCDGIPQAMPLASPVIVRCSVQSAASETNTKGEVQPGLGWRTLPWSPENKPGHNN